MPENDFDWEVPLDVDFAGLDSEQRREWLERVFGQIARETGSIGRDVMVLDVPWPHRVFRPRGGTLATELRILDGADRCVVTGRGQVRDDDIDAWRRAAAAAVSSMGLTNTFTFTAIVGVAPGPQRHGGRPLRLANASTLAGLRLTPIPVQIEDTWRPVRLDVAGLITESWPILVEGSISSFHPVEAARLAGIDLRLLCCLLSVLWRRPFVIRVAPILEEGDAVAYLQGVKSDWTDGMPPYDFEVPPWLQQGAEIAAGHGNEYLAQALGAFRDATLMEHELPSQACVAYVSVIESIGKKRGLHAGSAGNFREALKQVLYIDEARKTEKAYKRRCDTAHEGKVHGSQQSSGIEGLLPMLMTDDGRGFDDLLFALNKAARRLLWQELGGPQSWSLTENDMPRGLVAAAAEGGDYHG